MKRTLTLIGMSACVLLAFNSCRSNDVDADDYESAMPMATDSIADGDMPPWLIDDIDDGWGGQVAAGATTHDQYPIPEPGESVADVYGGGTSQNQPAVAVQQGATVHDTMIETPVPQSVAVTTPEPTSRHIGIEPRQTPVAKPTTPRKPEKIAKVTTTKKPSKKEQARKRGKRYTEPTLLTYKVRKGDNLSDIAKRSRTTVKQIKKDSGLKSDTIYPGQIIKVRYIPKDYKPSKQKQQQVRTHVVAKGQTISGIAKRYGVPYTDILKANGMSLKDASRIRPGKRLTIPAKSSKKNR